MARSGACRRSLAPPSWRNGPRRHEPLDLSHEEARTYFYPDPGEGFIQVEVEAPVSLEVENGHHFIVDAEGIGVIMAAGWSHIEVFPKQP
jgi:hypothetical protein